MLICPAAGRFLCLAGLSSSVSLSLLQKLVHLCRGAIQQQLLSAGWGSQTGCHQAAKHVERLGQRPSLRIKLRVDLADKQDIKPAPSSRQAKSGSISSQRLTLVTKGLHGSHQNVQIWLGRSANGFFQPINIFIHHYSRRVGFDIAGKPLVRLSGAPQRGGFMENQLLCFFLGVGFAQIFARRPNDKDVAPWNFTLLSMGDAFGMSLTQCLDVIEQTAFRVSSVTAFTAVCAAIHIFERAAVQNCLDPSLLALRMKKYVSKTL